MRRTMELGPLLLMCLWTPACTTGTIHLDAGMNGCTTVALVIESQVTASCQDTTIDWSGLSVDIFGASMDPAMDVAAIQIVRFGEFTDTDVTRVLNCESMQQSDVSGFAEIEPAEGQTEASLSDFLFFTGPVDPSAEFCDGMGAFLIQARSEDGFLSLTLADPTDGASPAPIVLDTETASFHTEFTAGDPVPRSDRRSIWVDWSDWAATGGGKGDCCGVCGCGDGSFDPSVIQVVRLARYGLAVADPRWDMLAIESRLAEETYEADVTGLETDDYELTSLVSEDGTHFRGFDGDGVWLLGLLGEGSIYRRPYFLGQVEN